MWVVKIALALFYAKPANGLWPTANGRSDDRCQITDVRCGSWRLPWPYQCRASIFSPLSVLDSVLALSISFSYRFPAFFTSSGKAIPIVDSTAKQPFMRARALQFPVNENEKWQSDYKCGVDRSIVVRGWYKNFHEVALTKYPDSLIYLVHENELTVIISSIYHHKRSPQKKYRNLHPFVMQIRHKLPDLICLPE